MTRRGFTRGFALTTAVGFRAPAMLAQTQAFTVSPEDGQTLVAVLSRITDRVKFKVAKQGTGFLDSLEEAYKEGDMTTAQTLLGYSTDDIDEMDAQLEVVRGHLPAASTTECPQCADVARNFATIRHHILGNSTIISPNAPVGDAPVISGCRWAPYLVALALCSRLGPLLYWACSYVAYCSNCYGVTRDQICTQGAGK